MRPGFTLLEVLVGLVIIGLVVAGIAAGARFGLGAAARQEATSERQGDLDAVDRTLRRLVEQADPAQRMTGGPGTLALVSSMPEPGGETVPAQLALGLEPSGDLVLRWTPQPGGRPLGPPPPARQTVLLHHVARIALQYWPRTGSGWRTSWTEAGLPRLVRLAIRFDAADGRVWPDMVIAPMRDGLQPTAPRR